MIVDILINKEATPADIARALRSIASNIELDATFNPSDDSFGHTHWDESDSFSFDWDFKADPADDIAQLIPDCMSCQDGTCPCCQSFRAA